MNGLDPHFAVLQVDLALYDQDPVRRSFRIGLILNDVIPGQRELVRPVPSYQDQCLLRGLADAPSAIALAKIVAGVGRIPRGWPKTHPSVLHSCQLDLIQLLHLRRATWDGSITSFFSLTAVTFALCLGMGCRMLALGNPQGIVYSSG